MSDNVNNLLEITSMSNVITWELIIAHFSSHFNRSLVIDFLRHSWLRRRLPKPPSDAPPVNRPSAVLRHHQLATIQQQSTSNVDSSATGGRINSGMGAATSNHATNRAQHHQAHLFSTNTMANSKLLTSTNDLNRHQKLPHIGGNQFNSVAD
jgi:hypothetical protein